MYSKNYLTFIPVTFNDKLFIPISLWLQMSLVFCYLPHLLLAKENFLYLILFHGNFIVFKFCFKSNFVLLEDQRGKKSNDGDIAMSSNVKEFSCLLVLSLTAVFSTLMDNRLLQ